MTELSRRSFLRRLAFGSDKLMSHPGEHTLVCIFLRGGADTLNVIVPYGDDSYYAARPTIAIEKPGKGSGSAIALDHFFGLHPKLKPLLDPYQEGRLGIVQAVGSDNTSGSHFEAQDQIEHGESCQKAIGGGWLGRHLRTRAGLEPTPLSAVSIGRSIAESLRGAPVATALRSLAEVQLDVSAANKAAVIEALSAMYRAEVGILAQPGTDTLNMLRKVEKLRAWQYKPAAGVSYPDTDFAGGLKEIARLIKAEVGLEAACLDLDGWDTHFVQGGADGLQATRIEILGTALGAFDRDLKGYHDKVTTIVMTEFGRRIYENGSTGTDHGRAYAFMAIGNRVAGGKVHGQWPGLKPRDGDILGPGGLDVLYDYRSVLAEVVAGACGNSDIKSIFPGFHPQHVGLINNVSKLQTL